MVRTRVGYAGGGKKDPTYHRLGDHSETIEIDYDPRVISYEQLLDLFWKSHDPTRRSWSTQYRAAIFYHDEDQKRLALASRDRQAARQKSQIHTAVEPATVFYLAEEYHQKHRLRQERDLMSEFRAMYPSDGDFVASTAAARVNGYLSGYGTREELQAELEGLGLSSAAGEKLRRTVRRSGAQEPSPEP